MREKLTRLTLFALPLSLLLGHRELFRIGQGGPPIYLVELFTLLFAILAWPEVRKKGWKRILELPKLIQVGALLMVPALAISLFAAEVKAEALGATVAWFIVPMILAALIIAARPAMEPLIFGIVIFALCESALAFYGQSADDGRLLGTFQSANHFAAVVVPAFFLSLLLPMKGKWLPMAVLVWALLMSQSLGGFLGLVGGGIYLLFQTFKSSKARIGMAIVIFFVGLIGITIARERFIDNPRSSLASRQEIWRVAWRIGSEHPITGIGLRNFDTAYEKTVTSVVSVPIEWAVSGPHNMYLGMWLSLSLIGLIAMLLIIGGVVVQGGVAVAAIVVLLTHGLVDTMIFEIELAFLFWLYCALALSLARDTKRNLVD